MLNHRNLRLGYTSLFWTILTSGIVVNQVTLAQCFSTPRLAVDAIAREPLSNEALTSGDFRVTKIQSDPVLRISWAIISSCAHPEWVPLVLPVAGSPSLKATSGRSSNESSETSPIVHAGDIVRLWSTRQFLRIEVVGISQQSGALGKIIRVRLARRSKDDQSIPEELLGVVRGPSSVEIQW